MVPLKEGQKLRNQTDSAGIRTRVRRSMRLASAYDTPTLLNRPAFGWHFCIHHTRAITRPSDRTRCLLWTRAGSSAGWAVGLGGLDRNVDPGPSRPSP
jgi:hypothetical protein